MWDGLAVLLFLSASLAVSSYLSGIVPLSFSLSPKHMRLLTACGTGILVGTALIVIIPEGVETLYSVKSVTSHDHRRLSIRGSMVNLETRQQRRRSDMPVSTEEDTGAQPKRNTIIVSRTTQTSAELVGRDDKDDKSENNDVPMGSDQKPDSHSHADEHDFEPHAWVGISIIAGFVLMYLIDKLPKVASTQSHLRPAYISLERMGFRGGGSEDDAEAMPQPAEDGGFKPSSTTTGLVIHAAADGIALGASSTASTQKLSMIIFFALMIHKAPAAFGLTAVLLKQGLSKRRAKAHLVVFSMAAPVGALVTWLFAHIIGGGSLGHESKTTFMTGLLLLFSGGTFL
ncbi:ZIP Zinc transporter-like protein 1 [Elsinoe australis]|uniref:ZIP Zinc transporter-like protein 1 n=1 Tax=Elsinoe australis TaxID=40998 RepID=A0A4U7B9J1_9PEZI|nr:ZIP Zinc transporter-like protein 1 [Elsinoe australis]